MIDGSCPNRGESPPMNTTTVSLVLMNYFPTNPNSTRACSENSGPLIKMMNTCFQQDGRRWPNFIAVDYYQVCIMYMQLCIFNWTLLIKNVTLKQFERCCILKRFGLLWFYCTCRGMMAVELQRQLMKPTVILPVDVTILPIARFAIYELFRYVLIRSYK